LIFPLAVDVEIAIIIIRCLATPVGCLVTVQRRSVVAEVCRSHPPSSRLWSGTTRIRAVP